MGQKTEKICDRAKVNLDKGNMENALRLFNEVLNREPTHPEALRNKALIKALNDTKDEAEDFLLFAVDQQPDDDQLYQILGTFYHNHEEPSKALAQFKKALELNEDNRLANKGIGMLYAHYFNEHEKAVEYFGKALDPGDDENDKTADIYFNRGCSNMILQNMRQAEEDLRTAAELNNPQAEEMLDKYFG